MSSGNTQLSFGLKKSTLNKLCSVFQSHGTIESVILYGSRAKGNYKVGSDIDLTIKGGLLPFFEFLQIEDQIDDLYLPYMVDLSQYKKLTNSDLIEHIDRIGVNIYTRETSNCSLQN